jgi:hypothetical protein
MVSNHLDQYNRVFESEMAQEYLIALYCGILWNVTSNGVILNRNSRTACLNEDLENP